MAVNPVLTGERRNQYTSSGSLGPYNFTFVIYADADIAVYVNDTLKTLTTHYTVSTNANGTGSITFTAGNAPASGTLVTIIGNKDLARTTVFTSGGPLTADALETEFNSGLALLQQLDEKISRAITLPIETDATRPIEFPYDNTEANNANRIIKFNAAGSALELGSTTTNIDALAAVAADIAVVSGISADVTAVAADATDIGIVSSNISSVQTVATNINDVITVANDLNEAISEVETVANDLNEAVSEIDTVGNNITYVQTVGDSTNIANITTVAGQITPTNNISTLAGIDTEIQGVYNIRTNITNVDTNSTNVNLVAGQISPTNNISTVAAANANISTIASNLTGTNTIGTVASNLTGSNTIGTVATNIVNVNAVGADLSGSNTIGTVATNLASVQNFAEVYRISATAPTTSLNAGDLYFDTSTNILNVYGASGWQNAGSSVNGTSQRYNYTATSGQTTFTGADNNGNTLAYDAGYIDVYLNGVKLLNGTDVTVTSGTSVVLATGATTGDIVDIVAYGTFSVASLNADNLDSGTVPTARVSGAYTGITQTGTLTSFASTGIDDNATSTAVTIDSSGNLLVGTTNTTPGVGNTDTGISLRNNNGGSLAVSRNGDRAGYFNRNTSDGDIVQFRKDGTAVGSIGAHNTRITIGNEDTGLKFNSGIDSIFPFDLSIQANRDNAVDLGFSTARFRDLYLGGGLYVGGTGTANYLDDYEEGTFTPTYSASGGGSVTMVATTGNYVKVGKIVHIQIRLMTSAESLSGNVTVTGLPFTSDSTLNHQTALSIAGYRFGTDMPNLRAYIMNNTTEITLDKSITTAVSNSYVTGADMVNSTNYNILKIAGSYEIS